LGAHPMQAIWKVIIPEIMPAFFLSLILLSFIRCNTLKPAIAPAIPAIAPISTLAEFQDRKLIQNSYQTTIFYNLIFSIVIFCIKQIWTSFSMINLQYFELKINPYFVWKKAIITKVLQKCRIMADFLMLQCKMCMKLFLNQLYIGKHTNNKEILFNFYVISWIKSWNLE